MSNSSLQRLHIALQHLQHDLSTLQVCFQESQKIFHEETRQRFLAEVMQYFPDVLTNWQCKLCVRDRVCWLGQPQGFLCAGYFFTHNLIPLVQDIVRDLQSSFLDQPEMSPEHREDLLNSLDFHELVALSFLVAANLKILPLVTKFSIRSLLYAILIRKDQSIYRLTKVSFVYIIANSGGNTDGEHDGKNTTE